MRIIGPFILMVSLPFMFAAWILGAMVYVVAGAALHGFGTMRDEMAKK